MNKKVVTIVVAVLIVGALAFWLSKRGSEIPGTTGGKTPVLNGTTGEGATGGDTTGEINAEIESIDVGDIDSEFKDIDADLNNL